MQNINISFWFPNHLAIDFAFAIISMTHPSILSFSQPASLPPISFIYYVFFINLSVGLLFIVVILRIPINVLFPRHWPVDRSFGRAVTYTHTLLRPRHLGHKKRVTTFMGPELNILCWDAFFCFVWYEKIKTTILRS